jgi:membrane-associated phospholipid phosphatase
VRDLGPVRDGRLRVLDLFGLAGIVTFPSFHATSAALYAWALWPVRWFRPIAILANAAMLASTPIDGGHYFVDLVAGIAVAVAAVVAARAVSRRLLRRAKAPLAVSAVATMSAAPLGSCQPNAQ